MKGEHILYPCYFNADLTLQEGRRVPHHLAVNNLTLSDIERALRRSNLPFRIDPKHHPSHWLRREGRIAVQWERSKGELLKLVAQHMKGKR